MIFNFVIGFITGALSCFLTLLFVAWLKLRKQSRLPNVNKIYKGRIAK